MLNPIEKFKVAILHLNRDWNNYNLFRSAIYMYPVCNSSRQLSGQIIHILMSFLGQQWHSRIPQASSRFVYNPC